MPETFHARFPVSVVFGLRPKTCRPAADEAPRHKREKISGTQGNLYARWLYFRIGFSAGMMIKLISVIFGILNKECSNFKKMLFIFL